MFLSCSTVFLAAAVMALAGNFESLPDYTPDANAERQTIPSDYIWDLTVLFPDDEAWMRRGTASGVAFTARAIPWILAGHVQHHFEVIRDRYLD